MNLYVYYFQQVSLSRHAESAFTQRTTNQEVAYKSVLNRAENSERRVRSLYNIIGFNLEAIILDLS